MEGKQMTEELKQTGCICSAKYAGECACDADWTDPEIYALREKVKRLEDGIRSALKVYNKDAKDMLLTEALEEKHG